MKEILTPILLMVVVLTAIGLRSYADVQTSDKPIVVSVEPKIQYVLVPVEPEFVPIPQPPARQYPPRCCQARYAFPILGAPIRLVGRVIRDIQYRARQCVHEE